MYFRAIVAALQHFRADAFLSVFDKILLILLASYLLLYIKPFKIEYFLFAQTLAYSLAALLSFFFVIKITKINIYLSFNSNELLNTLKKGAPIALMILLTTALLRTDAIMLERLLPPEIGRLQAEHYAAAYRLVDALGIVGLLVANVLLPIFSAHTNDRQRLQQLTEMGFSLLMTFSLLVALFLCYNQRAIMGLLYAQKYALADTAPLMGLLGFVLVGMACHYVFNSLLVANGQFKWLNRLAFWGLVFNILLNFWLIPQFGAKGAAVATLVTQAFMSLSQLLLCKKVLHILPNVRFIFRLLLASGLLYVFLLYNKNILYDNLIAQIFIFAIVGILVCWKPLFHGLREVVSEES